MRTRLHFHKDLSKLRTLAAPATSIVLYDRKLLTASPEFQRWIKKYPHAFSLKAGETLKSLSSFSKQAERIHRAVGENVTRTWTVVAVGGGSVGDFAGFFASVYRRGLRLVHIPSTWLAAIDSSHGGKTALNLRGAKNQIGTFYPSADTVLVKSLLMSLPKSNIEDGIGEIAKIALIDGHGWARKLKRPSVSVSSRTSQNHIECEWLWKNLKPAISSKNRIVNRDPRETRGYRQILNLGHTFGHVLEAAQGLSHGRSVALGLHFALELSESIGTIKKSRADGIRAWLEALKISKTELAKYPGLTVSRAARLLRSDKKRGEGSSVWFIVFKDFGRVERRELRIDRILRVALEKGWVR